jgi:hypothetical protein
MVEGQSSPRPAACIIAAINEQKLIPEDVAFVVF